MTGRAPASLSIRLIAGALVWLVLMLAVGGWVLASTFRDAVEHEFGHRLDATLRALVGAAEVGPDGTVDLARPLGDLRFEQIYSSWYWQLAEPSGRLVRSRSLWDARLPAAASGMSRLAGPKGEALLAASRDIDFPGAAAPVRVTVAGDLAEVDEEVRRFSLLLVVALGLLGLGLAAAIVIQVRFGLRPLRDLAAELEKVRAGEGGARLTGPHPREVAPLADAMNAVLDHDEALIERARTHVGNLAHALKTPLAILKAEAGEQGVIGAQVAAMTRLIEYHLARASAAAGSGRVLGKRVAVAAVAGEIAQALSRIHAAKGLDFAIEIPAEACFRGQREDLEEVLGNLMDNACKWAASRVRVSAAAEGRLAVTVEDDGPGLSPEQAEAAARRGARLDEGAPGWGLGLSIVADVVGVNGGSLEFARSKLGGLAAIVRFDT
jgi:signal transduction histidine kinase